MKNTLKTLILNRLHFLKIPELDLPPKAVNEFEEIFRTFIVYGNGAQFTYSSSYPVNLFLNYIIETKGVIVHGSNDSAIDIFEPREQTLFNGKKVKAVFASTDGNWSIFFAVVNRNVGSLRNACLTTQTKKGIRRYYYFSLNEDYKDEPWVNGTIYIFPKDGFKQGGIKDELICTKEVKPLAKLSVTPEDFIFREDVKRHKETTPPLKSMLKILVFGK